MQPIVSLVIPIYNGQSYIASLFQEILRQEVDGLEVILVDDGSTDGSATAIEAAIAADHSGIIWRLIRQENRGQGGARNAGLDAARGTWVMFVDQDDHLREDYLQVMLESVEAGATTKTTAEAGTGEFEAGTGGPCDILVSGYNMLSEDGSVILHVSLADTSWSRFMNVTPWGKVYRTAFLRDHHIRFYESPYGEDVYLLLLCEAAHARVRITSYVGYQWVQNAASVSHTTHRVLDREVSALSLFRKAMSEIPGLNLQDEELQYFFIKTAIYHVLCVAGTTGLQELKAYNQELFTELESRCPRILRNPLISPWRPAGERGSVRLAVWIYVLLHRLHLDGLFLAIYGTITR